MVVYNQDKTQILDSYDLSLGYLKDDFIDFPEVKAVQEQGHWETIAEYPETGGKDVEWIVDVKGIKYEPAKREEIKIFIPYTEIELHEIKLNNLRMQRETECFSIVNRGQLWYNNLIDEQKRELDEWYKDWLDVTKTEIIPTKPKWIK